MGAREEQEGRPNDEDPCGPHEGPWSWPDPNPPSPEEQRLWADLSDRAWAWVRAHGHEYPGEYLVLHGDRLLSHSFDYDEALDAAERTAVRPEESLVYWRPPQGWEYPL